MRAFEESFSIRREEVESDAAYIAHAANAYPAMLYWLKAAAQVLAQHKSYGTAGDIRAFLAELGEV